MQKQLLREVYGEAGINPATVSYVEAHGTGTKAGDPQEVNTICDVFCKNRTGPLPIGSVKSNMGHAEPASGTYFTFCYPTVSFYQHEYTYSACPKCIHTEKKSVQGSTFIGMLW